MCAIWLPHADVLTFHADNDNVATITRYMNLFIYLILLWWPYVLMNNVISLCGLILTRGDFHGSFAWVKPICGGNLLAQAI
jgi:hypothetical protein